MYENTIKPVLKTTTDIRKKKHFDQQSSLLVDSELNCITTSRNIPKHWELGLSFSKYLLPFTNGSLEPWEEKGFHVGVYHYFIKFDQ